MKLKNELPIIAIVALPFIYLAYIWQALPDQVPLHWNIKGEIDRFGDKMELILIPLLLPLLIYLIFLLVPVIDPKNKIAKMGNKYGQLKLLLTTFMSILALFILYSVKHRSLANPNYLLLILGILYVIFGNYFKTIKPNYFIGIRTPWTLENEVVWHETHKLAGKLWFVGGIVVVISSLILHKQANFIFFIAVTAVITLIPVIYSYIKFKNMQ